MVDPVHCRPATSITVAGGNMSRAIYLPASGAALGVYPEAGATARVFKSVSSRADVEADVADGSLSYANLLAGNQPTRSRWMPWTGGAVVSPAAFIELPAANACIIAVIATSTDGPAVFEIAC